MTCKSIDKFDFSDNFLEYIDPYKCIKSLGAGGFGETFLFKSGYKNIVVKAIKRHKGMISDVENEISILKKLSDSCSAKKVLCFKNIFKMEGGKKFGAYIITEYLEGGDMYDHYMNIQDLGVVDDKLYQKHLVTELLDILKQYIEGVEYIHSKGIVHYDLKPQNVMISRSGVLKIIDFGLAKSTDNIEYISSPEGSTPGYTPEDIEIQYPVDLFSKGVYFDFFALSRSFVKEAPIINLVLDVTPLINNKKLEKISSILYSIKYKNYKNVIQTLKRELIEKKNKSTILWRI